MKITIAVAAMLHLATAGHVNVRMPYLNPAGVTYYQGQHLVSPTAYAAVPAFGPQAYSTQHQIAYTQQQVGYEGYNPYSSQGYEHQQVAYGSTPSPIQYSHEAVAVPAVHHVPAVEVPTVHHVTAEADVPVTKIEAHHGVVQKVVNVAKPAIKTQKYEVRRPAIQKQFYDIEERTIIRPVGSALLELDEPISNHEKGPAVIQSLEDPHHKQIVHSADHTVVVASTPIPHAVAVTPVPHTVSITPSVLNHYSHDSYPEQSLDHHYIQNDGYAHQQVVVSSTPAPIHLSSHDTVLVSSTPRPHYESEDAIVVNSDTRSYEHANHVAHEQAVARANYNDHVQHEAISRANHQAQAEAHAYEEAIARENYSAQVHAHQKALARANAHAHHEAEARAAHAHQEQVIVESHSNGAPLEPVIVKNNVKGLNHLSHEEAHANQHKLIQLLTARGGVAEVGFGHDGPSEHVGDAGISRARVLSATPSPHHEPIEEKVKTRRIVVSRPVQTLQEIDVVQPATKVDQVIVNEPTVIKTAKLSYERIQTSVPVYGKALAHAQAPAQYYHK